ncbi:helix-turn-helix transcriptional regulator [Streptomyces malaysiensis]|uniref:helix-turn-helix transcriptional regulator n=1 Tax=Streptomyces malaysiensis TaxID=92644 RepID=UPI0036C6FB08
MQEQDVGAIFGARVRDLRTSRGWNQDELAEQLGRIMGKKYDPTTITRLEKGRRPVSLQEAAAITRLFGSKLQDMLSGDLPEMQQWLAQTKSDLPELQVDLRGLESKVKAQQDRIQMAQERITALELLIEYREKQNEAALRDGAQAAVRSTMGGDCGTELLRAAGVPTEVIEQADTESWSQVDLEQFGPWPVGRMPDLTTDAKARRTFLRMVRDCEDYQALYAEKLVALMRGYAEQSAPQEGETSGERPEAPER